MMGDRDYIDATITPFYAGHAWAPVQGDLANAWSQAYFHAQRKGRLCLSQNWPFNNRQANVFGGLSATQGDDYNGLTYGYRRLRVGHNKLRAVIAFACPILNEYTVTHRLSCYSFTSTDSDTASQIVTYQAGRSGLVSQRGMEDYAREITPGRRIAEPFSEGFEVNVTQLELPFSNIEADANKRCLIYLDVKVASGEPTLAVYQPHKVAIFAECSF